MAPKFGTSGLRGLVVELTEPLVREYTQAFICACDSGTAIYVGRDLRPSSPDIAGWVEDEITRAGLRAVSCGALPTPALALAAMQAKAGAIMVTGSHIPADRNGLKFYTPQGEITKQDETAILNALGQTREASHPGACGHQDAAADYVARYGRAFGPVLKGLRVGVYQHSSVARDIMMDVMQALGADPIAIARSDQFIPVDTEALDPETQALFAGWFKDHALDVLISTDGDADRPMVVDDAGRVVPGDVLGALTARMLGAGILCTPVSSNTQVDLGFGTIKRTRIGSPYVIAAMETALTEKAGAKVVGYEANGGFLLGFEAQGPAGSLAPLVTRDCLLPIIAPLAAAQLAGQPLSQSVDDLPPRFTAADRLQGIDSDRSKAFLAELTDDPAARAGFFDGFGAEQHSDLTDGLRLTFAGGDIIHLRPSGNAPEFRCYTEADSRERAADLLKDALSRLQQRLGS